VSLALFLLPILLIGVLVLREVAGGMRAYRGGYTPMPGKC
jgi:hypothetical protein